MQARAKKYVVVAVILMVGRVLSPVFDMVFSTKRESVFEWVMNTAFVMTAVFGILYLEEKKKGNKTPKSSDSHL
jgi:hypothetical protein